MALIVVVGAVLMGALGYGVVKSRTSPTPSPSVTPAPGTSVSGTAQPVVTAAPTLDCSKAEHPPQGSEARKLILDALRRHYRYDGLYTVQFVTVLNDWAYLEAAPFDEAKGETVGQFRGHVARWDGRQWNWRWEGATGAGADGAGDPPYPSDFQGAARDVLRC